MADVSKINFGDNIDRNVKDSVVREKLTVVDPSAGQGLIQFGVDANGNYGYKKVGADTVIPFKTGGGDLSLYREGSSSNTSSFTARYYTATNGEVNFGYIQYDVGDYIAIVDIINGANSDVVSKVQQRNSDMTFTDLQFSSIKGANLGQGYSNYRHIIKFHVNESADTIIQAKIGTSMVYHLPITLLKIT